MRPLSDFADGLAEALGLARPPADEAEFTSALVRLQMTGRKIEDHVVATLPDGREARLQLMLYGHVRLYWGQPGSLVYDDDSGFCYERLIDAVMAVRDWEAEGFEDEPRGWFRHVATGRRRPQGNPAREYVRP